MLKSDPTNWLLEKDNPSVRYFTLREILEKPEDDSEVIETKNDIMELGMVPQILAKQSSEGYWGDPQNFYYSKYRGTV
ncbi:MAG: hypothetical protein RMJ28_02540 [Nitrososphaerota archaeon]|nr:hypothetical protein [Nitrososphaerota archaeon]